MHSPFIRSYQYRCAYCSIAAALGLMLNAHMQSVADRLISVLFILRLANALCVVRGTQTKLNVQLHVFLYTATVHTHPRALSPALHACRCSGRI